MSIASVVGVSLIALVMNTWRLGLNGLGNQYYTAAARAMAGSWGNWFFVSLDPGGFISVDKPPVPLWITGLSARLFGVNTWSILLPSALAGAAAVAVLWVVVRRQFGLVAATIAGLVLALSPVNVAVNRLNLPESWLVLFLLGAVWALQRSFDSTRAIWWVVLAGSFIGLAFNTKMLAAYLVVPALGVAILLGASTWPRRIVHSLTFGVVSIATSLPWILIVDAVPASSRPWVGGSQNNTVTDLIFGYNGLGRVEGNGGYIPGGPISRLGGVFGGQPGPWRLLSDALAAQIAWLLPLAIVGGIAALWRHRRQRVRVGLVAMWALWLIVVGYVFSNAQGTFHAYYTALLGPAVAALVGIGTRRTRLTGAARPPMVVCGRRRRRRHRDAPTRPQRAPSRLLRLDPHRARRRRGGRRRRVGAHGVAPVLRSDHRHRRSARCWRCCCSPRPRGRRARRPTRCSTPRSPRPARASGCRARRSDRSSPTATRRWPHGCGPTTPVSAGNW